MSEETTQAEEAAQSANEFLEGLEENDPVNKVQVGPHPLGGIRVAVWDREQSTYVEQRIDIPDAAILFTHLSALLTMAFQTIYAEQARAAQQASSGLYVPGRS